MVVKLSEDETKVRCQLCIRYNSIEYRGTWILKKSFVVHQNSAVYQQSNARKEGADAEAARLQAATKEMDDFVMFNAVPNNEINQPIIEGPSNEEQSMWNDYIMHPVEFDAGESPEELLRTQHQNFELKAEVYGIWAGTEAELEEPGLNEAQQFWDDADEEDLLSEIMRNIGGFGLSLNF